MGKANPNAKEHFCRSLEWPPTLPITWFDKVGFYEYPGTTRLARIELHTHGTHEQYEKMVVTIKDKLTGAIDTKDFLFSDYLDFSQRSDDRKDYDGLGRGYIVNYCVGAFGWYIAVPKTTKPLTHAIQSYIDLFRTE